ncbi:MAG: hypothetical protein AAFP86_06755 [Planctomycetota bacterium]
MALPTLPILSLLALTAAATGAPQAAPDEPAGPITVRWRCDPPQPFVGQRFDAILELDLDAAWAESSLVQLFRQELDVPLQIEAFAPFGPGPVAWEPGAWTGAGPDAPDRRSVAADDARVWATATRPEPGTLRLEVRRPARFERARSASLPEARVTYSAATRFSDDVVRGRVPVDPAVGTVLGAAREIVARALPEDGRPLEFDGAVGSFVLRPLAPLGTVRTGRPFTVEVVVEGGSALPPDVEVRRDTGTARNVAWLGARRANVDEGDEVRFQFQYRVEEPGPAFVPAFTLCSFDPRTQEYVRQRTEPREVTGLPELRSPGEDAESDGTYALFDPEPKRPFPFWTVGMLLLVLGLAFASVLRRRGLIGAPGDPRAESGAEDRP